MTTRPAIANSTLPEIIACAWEARDSLSPTTKGEPRNAVEEVLAALDSGALRVAEKVGGEWQVHQWVKQAILLSFRLQPNSIVYGAATPEGQRAAWFDKVPLKTLGWDEADCKGAGFRSIPGSFIRHGAFVASGAVILPSFINIGAYVGEGTMIDTWSTVGSCAQIGKNCHISGGVGIGGVLEPLQAGPVIIEDNCFIGARSEIAEGVIVEEGAVISMGVFIGASTKIVDRASGEIFYGRVPAYSVVVPGTLPPKNPHEPSLACAVIVKRVDAKTRSKTSVNELLRD
jgi:2,3,4,5-tetrahydropyridine-2,6-dicarboxylate N-succinyltransferase